MTTVRKQTGFSSKSSEKGKPKKIIDSKQEKIVTIFVIIMLMFNNLEQTISV